MTLLTANGITVLNGAVPLVDPIDLVLRAGEPLVILGETGSGKSLLAQAIMGTLPASLSAAGRVTLGERALSADDPGAFRGLWGREIAVLPQEPWLSLDPLMRAGPQLVEAHRLVRGLDGAEARSRSTRDFEELGLPDVSRRYPHELSGGMAQRVAIASARAGGARIVIADEPTKGLDAARRDDVADLLLASLAQGGGLLVITHDLALARRIGGQLIVLREGAVVETGDTNAVLDTPQADYTRELIAADPENWPGRTASVHAREPVVSAERLSLSRGGQTLFAGLDLAVGAGQILGVTGPSGCGKSSLGDVLLGLLAPDAGIVLRARDAAPTAFQKLYQDPVAAFPRKRRLGDTMSDVGRRHAIEHGRVEQLTERLGLDPVLLSRYPDEVSGGELQRLALLRVMLARPRFLFADESTSRLDPITQASVIRLLVDMVEREGVAIMLVSHDGALIERTSDIALALGGTGFPDAKAEAATNAGADVAAEEARNNFKNPPREDATTFTDRP